MWWKMAVWRVCNILKFRAFSSVSRKPVLNQKNENISAIMLKLSKPRKPPNSFLRFLTESRDEIIRKNPGISHKDILKLASKMWADLPEKEKSSYILNYSMEMQEYRSHMENFLEEVKAFKKKELLSNGYKVTEAEKVLLGKPVKPVPSFFLFRASLKKASPNTTLPVSKIKEKWDACDYNEKKVFEDEYKRQIVKYQNELLEWEKEMYKKGFRRLIRPNTLSQLKKSLDKDA